MRPIAKPFSRVVNRIVLAAASCLAMQAGDISGKVAAGKGPSVVYLEATPGKTYAAPTRTFVMDQKKLIFTPHILPVPVGSTVEFHNSDNLAHNIFWPSISGDKKKSHNLGTWPMGQTRSFKFDIPGVVPLLCNVHPEMSGYIVVTPTPYFAQTDEAGNYKISDVPNGSYTVSAWHEGMKIRTQPVTVGGAATLNFSLSK